MKQAIFFLSIFLSSCSHLFYQPTSFVYTEPEKGGYVYSDYFFELDEETKLHAWKVESKIKEKKGTVVFFHGNGQNLTAHFVQPAFLVESGYQIFIWDYPGYGKSSSAPSQKNVFESGLKALEESYKWHQETNKGGKFIVWSQSLGGAVAIPVVAESKLEDKVDLLIVESSFPSYQDIAFDKLTISWLTYIVSPLSYVLVSDSYAADKYIERLKVKKALIVHSKDDSIVPYKFGKQIYDSYKGKKDLWTYHGKKHINIFPEKKARERLVKYLSTL